MTPRSPSSQSRAMLSRLLRTGSLPSRIYLLPSHSPFLRPLLPVCPLLTSVPFSLSSPSTLMYVGMHVVCMDACILYVCVHLYVCQISRLLSFPMNIHIYISHLSIYLQVCFCIFGLYLEREVYAQIYNMYMHAQYISIKSVYTESERAGEREERCIRAPKKNRP